jgi:hypothetical protein
MKKMFLRFSSIFTAAFLVAILVSSCGRSKKSNLNEEIKEQEISLTAENKMSGSLSQDFEVTKGVLKTGKYGLNTLMVEVKRTSSPLSFVADKSAFAHEGVAKQFEYDIKAEILGENDIPVVNSLQYSDSGPFVSLRSLKSGETAWLTFSASGISDVTKAKKVKLTSTLEKRDLSSSGGSSSSSSSSDENGSGNNTSPSSDSKGKDNINMDDIEKAQKALDKSIDQLDKINKMVN